MRKLFIIHFIAGIMYAVGGIWAIVSFILYLVKGQPFNWTSVWVCAIGIVLAFANMLRVFRR